MKHHLPDAFYNELHALPVELTSGLVGDALLLSSKLKDLKINLDQHSYFWSSLPRVWACSPYARRLCLTHPQWCQHIFRDATLNHTEMFIDYQAELTKLMTIYSPHTTVMRVLRHYRQLASLRIIWRDLMSWSNLDDTITQLSRLADTCIIMTSQWCHHAVLNETLSIPQPVRQHILNHPLMIIGLGKLGGFELNLSSDVDLMLTHLNFNQQEDIHTTNYYTLIAQKFIQVLNNITEDDFVLRVDLRLRPYGEGSQIVMSQNMMIDYYLHHAQPWERYPLIKSRLISGHSDDYLPLKKRLQKFVYGVDIDITSMYALRAVHTRLVANLSPKEKLHHIKTGTGGIRELEFIVQANQLLFGTNHYSLRVGRWRDALFALQDENYLDKPTVQLLHRAYSYFRHIEHRLQAVHNQQTHLLPLQATHQTRLAIAMHCKTWQEFLGSTNALRTKINQQFTALLNACAWSDKHLSAYQNREKVRYLPLSAAKLTTQYPKQHQYLVPWFQTWLNSDYYQKLSDLGHRRFHTFMPKLIQHMVNQNEDLSQLIQACNHLLPMFLERSLYMILLCDRPLALKHLLNLCDKSIWLTQQIVRYPVLLGELIEPSRIKVKMTLTAMETRLQNALNAIDENDVEAKIECLHHFKMMNIFRIASRQLLQGLGVIRVSDLLTNVATAITRHVYQLAQSSLPQVDLGDLIIVAYGKFGSIELGYHSDLDIICIYQHKSQQALLYHTQLCQKMLKIFAQRLAGSPLYEIDMRLRPNGQTGALVQQIDQLHHYLLNDAWTWEKQAIIRARAITGSPQNKKKFMQIRQETITTCCQKTLSHSIKTMRDRIRKEHLVQNNLYDLKHSPAGIIDIEFFTQHMCLKWAHTYPSILHYTDNIRQLSELAQLGIISLHQSRQLTQRFLQLRTLRQTHQLTAEPNQVNSSQLPPELDNTNKILKLLTSLDT